MPAAPRPLAAAGRATDTRGVNSRRLAILGALAAAMTVHLGCGGDNYVPLNPFVDLRDRGLVGEDGAGVEDGTIGATVLPAESAQPQALRVGETLAVYGRGRVFPRGFARFVFTGNSTTEVELTEPRGVIQVPIPAGTLSGPFGFTISHQSDRFEHGLSGLNFTGPSPVSYRVEYPGIRVLTPGQQVGGTPGFGAPAPPVQPPLIPGQF